MSELPENYGTPEYEAAWMREKLNLPVDAKTSQLQGAMHVVCHEAHGYDRYIKTHKCDDKQGEIARQSVQIAELQAENERLREENDQIAQSAIDIVTVECERPEHKALNFSEWMEQGGGACSVCMTEKLASAEQRAARAELLVRLMRTGKIVFLIPWLISISHGEMVTFHRFTEPGIPDLTTEQWERLEQLERGTGC